MKKEEAKKLDYKSDNSFGVASAILGIIGLLSAAPFYGIIAGILAVAFAVKQNKRRKNGWAKAGLVLGIIGIILNILAWIFLWWISQNPELLAQYGGNAYALQ